MSSLRANLRLIAERWRQAPRSVHWGVRIGILIFLIVVPYFTSPLSSFNDNATRAMAYVVMALGLNIVVGFAGLLDLGYVAFFAFGAYTMGWLGSGFAYSANGGKGIHVGVTGPISHLPGIHLNFLLIVVGAVITTA